MMLIADKAAKVLRRGGVIAYPTEGVFGLGCLPHNLAAVQRLLNIKQREVKLNTKVRKIQGLKIIHVVLSYLW